MRLRYFGILMLAAAGLAGLWLLIRPQPVPVEVARVTRGDLEQTVEEDGVTRVIERYTLSAPIAGTVQRIALKAGDAVSAGDVLAILRPSPAPMLDARARLELEQRVGAAEAARQRTTANITRMSETLAQANADLERTRDLAARGVVAQSKLEHDTLAARVAERLLEVARHEDHAAAHDVDMARAALAASGVSGPEGLGSEILELRSPIAGQVLRVLQVSEAAVATGAPLLEIGDVRELEVVVDLLSTDAVMVAPGAPVHIERWGGSKPLEGRVRRVEPGAFTKISALGVEEQRTNVVIDILTPPEQRVGLGDGYRVDARIQLRRLPDVVKLPTSALFRDAGGWAVYQVVDGVARKRAVTVMLLTQTESAVAEGVLPGDLVVVYPGDTLAGGMRVTVQGQATPP